MAATVATSGTLAPGLVGVYPKPRGLAMDQDAGSRVGSIGSKLASLVVALVGGTTALVVGLGYRAAREECVRQIEQEYASSARASAARLSNQLLASREALRALAEDHVVGRAASAFERGQSTELAFRRSTLPVLASARSRGAHWLSVAYEDGYGIVRSSTDPDEIGHRRERAPTVVPASVELARRSGAQALRVRVPLGHAEPSGSLVALVAVDPILDPHSDLLVRDLRFGPDPGAPVASDPIQRCLVRAAEGARGVERIVDEDGAEHLVAFEPIPGTPFGLVAHARASDAFAALERLRSGSLWLLAGALLVALVAALLLARHFAQPVRELVAVTQRVAAGDLTARARVTRNDELGMLAADFNRMTTELERSHHSLERRVRERTEELAALNSELALFSQSVAHDFTTPLRSIAGFSKILSTEKAEMMDPEGRLMLERMRHLSERLGRLVEDLLSFAGIGRHELRFERVRPREIVRDLLGDFDEALKGRSVEFELRELPESEADAALLSLVFSNLISNAIKFTQHRERAHIVIGAENRGGETVYFVRDDGAGFDMSEASRLFELFQRLHEDADFVGTGLGLAISRRIVERHGGRMWAEGRTGVGACFYFTLAETRGAAAPGSRADASAA